MYRWFTDEWSVNQIACIVFEIMAVLMRLGGYLDRNTIMYIGFRDTYINLLYNGNV